VKSYLWLLTAAAILILAWSLQLAAIRVSFLQTVVEQDNHQLSTYAGTINRLTRELDCERSPTIYLYEEDCTGG